MSDNELSTDKSEDVQPEVVAQTPKAEKISKVAKIKKVTATVQNPWSIFDHDLFYVFPVRDWLSGNYKKARPVYVLKSVFEAKELMADGACTAASGYACLKGRDLIAKYRFSIVKLRSVCRDDR